MITFRVVKDQYGWAVLLDDGMTMPFRSRELAIREAECLTRELKALGQAATIMLEDRVLQRGSPEHLSAVRTGVLVPAS